MIHPGTEERIIGEVTVGAGSTSRDGVIQSDALLATLWVNSITSGTLTVSIFQMTDFGKESLLFTFPVLSAPSTELVIKKSGVALSRFRVQVDYTGVCDYEIYIRAVNNSGESSTRILGSGSWEVSQTDITTSASILIPASLNDRNGLVIKNWDDTATIYLAETLAKATTAEGYPLAPRDALAMDISAGTEVYAVSDSGTADVRIAESGT